MKPWWEAEVNNIRDALMILRAARKYMRDSAHKVAEILQVSEDTLRRWERGKTQRMRCDPSAEAYIIDYVKKAQEEKRRRISYIASAFAKGQ